MPTTVRRVVWAIRPVATSVKIANGRERRNAGRNDSSSVCHDAGRGSPASIGGTSVDTSVERVFITADALLHSVSSHTGTPSHAYHIRHIKHQTAKVKLI
jgi:hypothetical protein